MLDSAKVVDTNFVYLVRSGELTQARIQLKPEQVGLTRDVFLELFHSQLISRHLDLMARLLKDFTLLVAGVMKAMRRLQKCFVIPIWHFCTTVVVRSWCNVHVI